MLYLSNTMKVYPPQSMARCKTSRIQKARELRRRVVVPARLRHGAAWSDACILNISSCGLMIHTGRQIAKGAQVELRRGDHVIVARVVWRDGAKAGLRADDRIPVEAMMTLGKSSASKLVSATGERRRKGHWDQRSRLRGKAIEFAGIVVIAVFLASAGLTMVEAAFEGPMGLVRAALTN